MCKHFYKKISTAQQFQPTFEDLVIEKHCEVSSKLILLK